jgi:hypothetical protein
MDQLTLLVKAPPGSKGLKFHHRVHKNPEFCPVHSSINPRLHIFLCNDSFKIMFPFTSKSRNSPTLSAFLKYHLFPRHCYMPNQDLRFDGEKEQIWLMYVSMQD